MKREDLRVILPDGRSFSVEFKRRKTPDGGIAAAIWEGRPPYDRWAVEDEAESPAHTPDDSRSIATRQEQHRLSWGVRWVHSILDVTLHPRSNEEIWGDALEEFEDDARKGMSVGHLYLKVFCRAWHAVIDTMKQSVPLVGWLFPRGE